MTTKVIISSPAPNHLDVQIEVVGLDGAVWNTYRLTDGESREVWVHGHMTLRVSEIPKLASGEGAEEQSA